ncbi:MAG: hypothetical protein JO108_33815 [Acidobacteriaceae bacterium]|nr:hypothetical protein [Acidobacteriaceae bacterium]
MNARLIVAGIGLGLLVGIPLRQTLRSGVISLRGGPRFRIVRRTRPYMYWASIFVHAGFVAVAVSLIAWGIQ